MLRLTKSALTDLTSDELAGVVAGAPDTNDERCVSGVIQCTADVVTEKLTLKTYC